MGRGVCGLEIYVIPDAQGSVSPEGDDDLSVSMGEEWLVSGGVYDHGTQEEDGPGTLEKTGHSYFGATMEYAPSFTYPPSHPFPRRA